MAASTVKINSTLNVKIYEWNESCLVQSNKWSFGQKDK